MAGRPKTYDDSQVLDAAMRRFWNFGYDATSYGDIVDATGLGRQSLYLGFGDKKALFSAVLKRYGQTVTQQSIDILTQPGSPGANIRQWLNRLQERACRERTGCLLTNTAVEMAPHDSEIQKIVRRELRRVESSLRRTLTRAVGTGELAPTTDARAMATYFLGIAQGLMVMGRLGHSQTSLKQYVDTALQLLESAYSQPEN